MTSGVLVWLDRVKLYWYRWYDRMVTFYASSKWETSLSPVFVGGEVRKIPSAT